MRVPLRLTALAAAVLAVAACGPLGLAPDPPAPSFATPPKSPPLATGQVNGVTWAFRAWVDPAAGLTCTSLDTSDTSGFGGCGNGRIGPTDLDIPRQVGDRFIALTGLVGERIVKIRDHFGDGTAQEFPTMPSPIAGARVAAVVVRPAPVPTSVDGLTASGEIVATTRP